MLSGAGLLVAGLWCGALIASYPWLLALWVVLGIGYSLTQTPSGRLLRRSSSPADRPSLFAAQFALSHACWLITYPVAGWLGARIGLSGTFAILGAIALAATLIAAKVWPRDDPDQLEHEHDDMDESHEHLGGGGKRHRHSFVIDEDHRRWPRQ
tara:strand:- start:3953 stop:4414 length:462 start_codon:yes stop_codon:yes gene_type:complete